MLGVRRGAKEPVVGGRYPRLPHQFLGEDLAPLKFRGIASRAKDPQPFTLKRIHNPGGEGFLGSDDRQADSFAFGELNQGPEIAGFNRHVLRIDRRPCVPRCAKDACNAR